MARKPKVTYEASVLPSNFSQMESYIKLHKADLTEKVLDCIDYAIKKKLKLVEVFKFENSEFLITLTSDKFEENITNVYDYYIKEEKYELCPRVIELKKKLQK